MRVAWHLGTLVRASVFVGLCLICSLSVLVNYSQLQSTGFDRCTWVFVMFSLMFVLSCDHDAIHR